MAQGKFVNVNGFRLYYFSEEMGAYARDLIPITHWRILCKK